MGLGWEEEERRANDCRVITVVLLSTLLTTPKLTTTFVRAVPSNCEPAEQLHPPKQPSVCRRSR